MSDINEEIMLDPAPPEPMQSRFATVVTLDTLLGMQLQMDGEEEASEKYYPFLLHVGGAELGDRVLVEHISGTMIVTGIVAPPFREMTAAYAKEAGHANTANYADEAENAINAINADFATQATSANSAITASTANEATRADYSNYTHAIKSAQSSQYLRFHYDGNFYIGYTSSPTSNATWRKITIT